MIARICHGAVVAGFLICAAAQAQVLRDVPASHWARAAVVAVTSRGVMTAPGGKFDGDRALTRTELAVTMARFARSLQDGRWPKTGAPPIKPADRQAVPGKQPVTRYVLAAAIDRVARYAMQGLPTAPGKLYDEAGSLPPVPKLTGIPKTHPAYPSLAYLAKNHMVWAPSVLLKPGNQTVTGDQVADALASVVAGLNNRLTDEPQNREPIGPLPAQKQTESRK